MPSIDEYIDSSKDCSLKGEAQIEVKHQQISLPAAPNFRSPQINPHSIVKPMASNTQQKHATYEKTKLYNKSDELSATPDSAMNK